ncbi:MAG TPA: radical SAM protein [Thermoanaerobaculia bacterium]|nr:radical SAM protein [Thermoanaerobaculia bacterium]
MKNNVFIEHMRISVSYQCNLHCEHCYVPEDFRMKYREVLGDKELTLDQIRAFIDELIENHGLEKISVTGGETLIKSVWERTRAVLAHANLRKLRVQVNTGGFGQIPVPDIVGIFDDPSKLTVQISLDGSRAETVDRFRGRRGVFDSALRYMSDLTAAGAKVQARYTINESNYDETLGAYELVGSIPIASFKVKPMFAAGTAVDNHEKMIHAGERLGALQRDLVRLSSRVPTYLEVATPVFFDEAEFEDRSNWRISDCTCGMTSGYLSSSGDLYACSYGVGDGHSGDLVVGNIGAEGFDFARDWVESRSIENYRDRLTPHECPSSSLLLRNIPVAATSTSEGVEATAGE